MSGGILFGNRLLDVAVVSCFSAQFYKVFFPVFKGQKPQWARLIQTGGMPSSHSSVVIALATLIALHEGVYSSIFGLAFVFAMIVIYDSMKVRFSNGVQAQRINEIIESQNLKIKKVRVVKGHTPLEVAVGSAIGIFIGCVAFFLGL